MTMEVLKPGSTVYLNGDQRATVVQVNIQNSGYVQYQVVYWSGSQRQLLWVEEFEVYARKPTPTVQIGFRGGE